MASSSLQKAGVMIPIPNVASNSETKLFIKRRIHCQINFKRKLAVSCAKAAEPINTSKSDASVDRFRNETLEKKPLQTATFPNGFEALVLDVCDETQIDELKVKVGEFEMHLKRNIGATKVPLSNISPTTPPPVPTKPMVESTSAISPPSPPKSSAEKTKPFLNVPKDKSQKLASLEASGTNNYVLVPSPTVGSFRSGRTIEGKKQPSVCREFLSIVLLIVTSSGIGSMSASDLHIKGDLIKEGQVIGYLNQFGTSVPVKSDVAGEVLKLLFQDGGRMATAIQSSHYQIYVMASSSLQKAGVMIPIPNVASNSETKLFIKRRIHCQINFKRKLAVSCAKAAEPINTSKSDASVDTFQNETLQKKPLQAATFPNGFEALVLDVCDETQIAELKVKVGEFEMHLKRNIGATKVPLSNISPTTPPPVPTKPMVESTSAISPPSPPKSSAEKTKPFLNVPKDKSQKLASLEASGTNNYVLVPSPTVGLFRSGRTIKGKKQPSVCREGDLIKEGQVIGYLDQFGTSLPVKSDVAGEVLKLLFQDGDAVGYGDPLIAVLPSFHDIK
ncbi:hypothetical protein RIF29_17578 [Crotalaria pallida]|uniref:Lipoyl-binding domain-containing protein n=1 Tax=Crotalaria pallida TaxID=3830 RepID=A0AAN9FIM0_CROPI